MNDEEMVKRIDDLEEAVKEFISDYENSVYLSILMLDRYNKRFKGLFENKYLTTQEINQ